MSQSTRKRTIRNRDELRCAIKRQLDRQRFTLNPSWPYTVGVELLRRDELMDRYVDELERDADLRDYAESNGCTVDMVNKQAGLANGAFVRSITVPSEECALRMMSRDYAAKYRKSRKRLGLLREEFPAEDDSIEKAAKLTDGFDDVDFELTVRAARYFEEHDVCDMTARQVPLVGFHGKWLDGERSVRRRAISLLIAVGELRLKERPGEIRLRMLGGEYQGFPDFVAVQPWVEGVPGGLHTAIIVENKDTYQNIPAMEGGICIWGCGWSAPRIPLLLPWLKDLTHVFYWGDMDAAGLEILNEVRGKGLPCESVLMDMTAYRRYERYGTNEAPLRKRDGVGESRETPIGRHIPRPVEYLDDSEQELYRRLCAGEDIRYLRIEQERIPLDDACREIALLTPVV